MAKPRHGHYAEGRATPTYRSWSSMKTRCDNKNQKRFYDYGGRGISYDPRWSSFDAFLEDMGERPAGTTLDRIDSDANYCKANCRWATYVQQANNRKMFSTNTSGVTGVYKERRQYRAIGYVNKERVTLYAGRDFESAVAARKAHDAAIDAALTDQGRAGEGCGDG